MKRTPMSKKKKVKFYLEGLKARALQYQGKCPHDPNTKDAYMWWKSSPGAALRRALLGDSCLTPGSTEHAFWFTGFQGRSFPR